MESVIQVVRGSKLEGTFECVFCGSTNNSKIFGIVGKKTFDGILFRGFPICKEHLEKLNALLSGEFDIDNILLEQYRKPIGKSMRLRG